MAAAASAEEVVVWLLVALNSGNGVVTSVGCHQWLQFIQWRRITGGSGTRLLIGCDRFMMYVAW